MHDAISSASKFFCFTRDFGLLERRAVKPLLQVGSPCSATSCAQKLPSNGVKSQPKCHMLGELLYDMYCMLAELLGILSSIP